MAEHKRMARRGEGDCAVRVFLDQDTDGHCWRLAAREGDVAGHSSMSNPALDSADHGRWNFTRYSGECKHVVRPWFRRRDMWSNRIKVRKPTCHER
jgi:hypothetical protein